MLKAFFIFTLLFSSFAFAKKTPATTNRTPAAAGGTLEEVKATAEKYIESFLKLEHFSEPLECHLGKKGDFICSKTEMISACASGTREASTVEVRGSVEGPANNRYIQFSELTYRSACFGKN